MVFPAVTIGGDEGREHVILDLMRDASKRFPEIPNRERITALRVWHCKYTTLAPIGGFSSLRTLVIAGFPDESLRVLQDLPLTYLQIVHLPKVTELASLRRLERLRTVRLATLPSWDSARRVQEVDSLRPLAELPHLRHLELFGVVPKDTSLRDLETPTSLISVRVSKYPDAEVARFRDVSSTTDARAPGPGVEGWA